MRTGHARILCIAGKARRRGITIKGSLEHDAIEAVKSEAERPLKDALRKVYRDQSKEARRRVGPILASVRSVKNDDPMSFADALGLLAAAEFVERILSDSWEDVLTAVATAPVSGIYEVGYTVGTTRSGGDDDLDFQPSSYMQDVTDALIDKIKTTDKATRDHLRDLIAQEIANGSTPEQITNAVGSVFNEWEDWRVEMIAQTTGTGAFEAGQIEAYGSAGITQHSWATRSDGRERRTHSLANGETIGVGDLFSMGLRYPGDPLGPAAEVINCRCHTVPVITPRSIYSQMNAKERQRVEMAVRDYSIRMRYPELRETMTQLEALDKLGDTFHLSTSSVKKILWENGGGS